MSRHPEVKWAEREDKVYLTVMLADAKDPKVDLDPEGIFTFTASAGADNTGYELKLELFDKVDVAESKINYGVRNIFCILIKAESKWWNRLLRGDGKTPHNVKVDWDKWVDEDDDEAPADVDTGGMDFSKFGDMGGMGGMGGGMGGMGGGMGGMDMASMMGGMGGGGGMGGMDMASMMAGMGGGGGMGGMDMASMMAGMGGGMGGMDDMGEDESDEEGGEEVTKPEGVADDKAGK